jgi:hypothetical protein
LKHIILKVRHDKFQALKNIIKEVKDQSPNVTVSPIKQGNIGDDIMASFSIDDSHYQIIMDKLDKNGISLFGNKDKNEKKRVSLGNTNNSQSGSASPVESKTISKNDTPAAILEFAIKTGDYAKVIQLSKDYRSGFEVLKKAKDSIDNTIKNAVDNAYNAALKNKFDVSNSLNALVKIASDKELKSLHKVDLTKSAGLKAVDLCARYAEHINVLVQICNNNAIPQIVCMKAAIKLAYILANGNEQSDENLDYSVKYLNLRWLNIVFHTVNSEITEKEKGIFNALISGIKEKFDDSASSN